jgi:hypothetical protein
VCPPLEILISSGVRSPAPPRKTLALSRLVARVQPNPPKQLARYPSGLIQDQKRSFSCVYAKVLRSRATVLKDFEQYFRPNLGSLLPRRHEGKQSKTVLDNLAFHIFRASRRRAHRKLSLFDRLESCLWIGFSQEEAYALAVFECAKKRLHALTW